MEAALLRELNWEVVMLTPSHFVDAFLGISGGATFPSDTIGGQPWAEVAAEYLEKYTIFFSVQVGRARAPAPPAAGPPPSAARGADRRRPFPPPQCLVDVDLLCTHTWPASLVAAAVIMASRFQLQIYPVWPLPLQELSSYTVYSRESAPRRPREAARRTDRESQQCGRAPGTS